MAGWTGWTAWLLDRESWARHEPDSVRAFRQSSGRFRLIRVIVVPTTRPRRTAGPGDVLRGRFRVRSSRVLRVLLDGALRYAIARRRDPLGYSARSCRTESSPRLPIADSDNTILAGRVVGDYVDPITSLTRGDRSMRQSFPPRCALTRLIGSTATAAILAACGGTDGAGSDARLVRPDPAALSAPAPDSFKVAVETSKGNFTIVARRDWAPRGVDRFYHLVQLGFYD